MAIGRINGGGVGFGQRKLGVQPGRRSALEFLGGGKAENLIAINLAGTVGQAQTSKTDVIVKGLQNEIERTQGFRTDISSSDRQRLEKYRADIVAIEQEAQKRPLTPGEISDRARYYVESYRILGKDYISVENDSFLKLKSAQIDALVATKPTGADAARLARLQTNRDSTEREMNAAENGPPITLYNRLRSLNAQIGDLTRPRKISTLSSQERRQYDDLVAKLNAHAGQELQLDSRKKMKIERLQATIEAIQGGGVNTII